MSDELKPCPCCGSENVHAYNSKAAQYRQYSIKCTKCGIRVCKATLAEATEVWNRRVEPERKKGEWLGKPIAGKCTVKCSACGEVFLENSGEWKFCPNCGADMRGE